VGVVGVGRQGRRWGRREEVRGGRNRQHGEQELHIFFSKWSRDLLSRPPRRHQPLQIVEEDLRRTTLRSEFDITCVTILELCNFLKKTFSTIHVYGSGFAKL
jgi:hypothetical protein